MNIPKMVRVGERGKREDQGSRQKIKPGKRGVIL
jgi:hypothetical protein